MITRIFRVRVPAALHQAFEADFLAVSLPLVKAHRGLIDVRVGRPTCWTPEEYLMISTWQDERCLIEFAGSDWQQAVIPAGMAHYASECWVHHAELFG
ncbi:antibiotic biosynthesis monooxygenase [Neisseriaceae bacterium JH1-16]|nr:antibiotic biosynthesis monooxygenase [Neisseriaceae bacterium JH1-16]